MATCGLPYVPIRDLATTVIRRHSRFLLCIVPLVKGEEEKQRQQQPGQTATRTFHTSVHTTPYADMQQQQLASSFLGSSRICEIQVNYCLPRAWCNASGVQLILSTFKSEKMMALNMSNIYSLGAHYVKFDEIHKIFSLIFKFECAPFV
uniref:Uncharacterized protein n=1 Tax=Leersia perrieri TaxID=77586 RepID=A0A0D9X835_9ORYZ